MRKKYITNVFLMMKFIIKRDKYRLLIWVMSLLAFDMVVINQIVNMYPTQVDRDGFKIIMENPAMQAMFGSGYGLDNYTNGPFWAHMMYVWVAMILAVMAIMLVCKNLRAEEEEGRYEMIRSFPVGRDSNLLATMLVMAITFIVFGFLKGLSLAVLGIEDIDFAGSLNYGLGLGSMGIFFVAISAVIAQLYQSNRSVMSTSFLTLLGVYILFSIGTMSSDVLLWISPFKWMVHSQPYVNNYYWPIVLILIVSAGLGYLALYLSSIRDLDAGFFKTKKGKTTIAKRIKRPFGFTLRLVRTQLIIWVFAMFVLGASYGSIFGDLEAYLATNAFFEDILPELPGVPLAVQFMGFIMVVLGIVSTIPAITMMNRLSSEEGKHRMEIMLSHSVSRWEITYSTFLVAVITGVLTLFMSAFGMYSASFSAMDDPIQFGTFLGAIMAYLPSLLFMLGVSVLINGLLPTKSWLIWVYVGFGFFTVYIGQLLDLPEIVAKLSPFGHVPKLPVDDMNWLTQIIILLGAFGLSYLGYMFYNKRDIQA